MTFKISNIKKNWEKSQQDPYFAVKMNYKITRVFIYFIMIIVAIGFLGVIFSFKGGLGWQSLLVKGVMVVIGIYMLFTIYNKFILPQKKILQHYENVPTPIASKYIDVEQEVDDILESFDKKERGLNTKDTNNTKSK